MYIYPSSPESASSLQSEESAAVKIQAGFRGYRVRQQLHRLNKSTPGNRSTNGYTAQRYSNTQTSSSSRRQHRHKMEEKKPTQTANCQQSPNTQRDLSVEDRCATKIQAGFRGFLVRKKQKIETDAAVKIQSSFRGFKARKEAEKMKHS